MHGNSAACGIYWWHDITIRVWHDNASNETTTNAFGRLVRFARWTTYLSHNAKRACFVLVSAVIVLQGYCNTKTSTTAGFETGTKDSD